MYTQKLLAVTFVQYYADVINIWAIYCAIDYARKIMCKLYV